VVRIFCFRRSKSRSYQQRAAAGWSFTDCTSKIVIDDLSIKTAVALDIHFRQFGIAVVP